MRKYIPLAIISLALGLYWARDVVLVPLHGNSERGAQESAGSPGELGGEFPLTSGDSLAGPITTVSVREGKISRGTSFFVEMQQAGIAPVDIHDIVRASRKIFNFRRIRPGQRYALYQGSGGTIDSLHFVIDEENLLKVAKTGDTFEARRDTVAYRVEYLVTGGRIESSIYEALQAQGANPELASRLAVIFQWDIDFFKDIRKGDTFHILYENRVFESGKTALGAVLSARVHTQGEEHYAFRYRRADGGSAYYDARGRSLQKSLLKAPLRYARISSNFTYKRLHPVTRTYKPHLGVDYVAPRGTPVRSTGDGTVTAATFNRGNGNYVKIRHNSRYETYYLHLSKFAKGIRAGRRVKQGQVIGYVGSTGLVTATHLDYRIKVDGRFVNPRRIKLPSKEPIPGAEREFFEIAKDSYLVRLFEANLEERTVLVRRPRPPLQERIITLF